jgi:stage III sporulation protein AH
MVKKNQMIITALAIMIAVAGYLNFAGTKFEEESFVAETSANVEEQADISDLSEEDIYAAGNTLTDGNVVEDLASNEEEGIEYADIESLDSEPDPFAAGEEGLTPGEAVLTSSSGSGMGIVANAKLMKEQTRAKNKETLLEVINNGSITEEQKTTAINSMVTMTDIAERETAAEILLTTKGFSDSIVSITEDTVDVMINAAELTDAQRAQIEDIVKRKTGIGAEGIVITPILAQ